MKPPVSVIVTTKNNEQIIERCLRSLKLQSYTPLEIIVVDNASSDHTQDIARHFTTKVYPYGPERSAQRNFGARKARGRYLFFIDSDMEVGKNVVRECVETIKGHVALVVPEIFVGEGFWARCKVLEKSCYSQTDDGVAARFFMKKAFFEAGGYDEALTGPEDIDLHKRVALLGRIGSSPAPIIHYDGRLTLQDIVRKRYYYSLSLPRYLHKHPTTSRREFRFIRPAYLRQWKRLAHDPVHLVGMLVMRAFEGCAVLLALRKARQ